jgi:hypothetical protein
MFSLNQYKICALEWAKNYLINEMTPPPWLCALLIFILEMGSKSAIEEISIFGLLATLLFRYNFLFLIPFDPTAGCLPITSIIFAASLLSCNCKWKQYLRTLSLLVYFVEEPKIKLAVAAASSIFMAGIIFRRLEFENVLDNIQGFQIFFGTAVSFSILTMTYTSGLENNFALLIGCFLASASAGRLIIIQRVE